MIQEPGRFTVALAEFLLFITIFSCHFYRGGARMDGNFGGVTVCFLSRLEGFFSFLLWNWFFVATLARQY